MTTALPNGSFSAVGTPEEGNRYMVFSQRHRNYIGVGGELSKDLLAVQEGRSLIHVTWRGPVTVNAWLRDGQFIHLGALPGSAGGGVSTGMFHADVWGQNAVVYFLLPGPATAEQVSPSFRLGVTVNTISPAGMQ